MQSLNEVREFILPLMDGFDRSWCLAGGWAIDFFLGRTTRLHQDLEIAVYREDQLRLQRQLKECEFSQIVDAQREAWPADQFLNLPVHELRAWDCHRSMRCIEILLNERQADRWVFRRNASVTLHCDRAVRKSACGMPILTPEIVLLFKAKAPRDRDERDFLVMNDALSDVQRDWLRESLALCHPGHAWIKQLPR